MIILIVQERYRKRIMSVMGMSIAEIYDLEIKYFFD